MPAELRAVGAVHAHPAVVGAVGLVGVVLELDREVCCNQPLEERVDAGSVVVPSPSVHVGAVREGNGGGGGARARRVESVDVGGVVAGGHGGL